MAKEIPIGSFVFTVALMCHGTILYRSPDFSHISRLISSKTTKVGCPTLFAAIDSVLDELHGLFYKDLNISTESIIEGHENYRTYPLLIEKLLFYDYYAYTEQANRILGINNKYEDGIYLISIHKKTENGLQNIEFGTESRTESRTGKKTPLNLLLPESWSKLGINLYNSSENSLTNQFSQVDKSVFKVPKKQLVRDFKLFIHKGRIQEIKLSTILELLLQYDVNHDNHTKGHTETQGEMHFFNVYDFTCNGFASSMTDIEREHFTEEFKELGQFETTLKYGGKKNTRKIIKKKTMKYV